MLKLERMEISGFKSFSARTEVRFPEGITAVVGPNGCGKSNIGDALNWALGEQSPRMLRGKQMADVIFSGSRARKPLGMAEVSIYLGGATGLPFVDQGRIVVTRRLFRSGESDYLINGKRARLKDIQEVLDQARVGARSYATIEQGKIDQILNAKPKDRRQIIEDAAGVAGYKHKRRLTELKLEATHANLLRVNDIVVEVERQIRSLKRQAGKARRYRRLREELREKECTRFGMRAVEMDAELDQLRDVENNTHDREAEAAAQASRIEVELIGDREALDQQNRAFREASERLHQLEIEIDRSEGQIATCKERIEELEQLSRRQDGESEALATRRTETLGRAEEQRNLVDRGKAELDELTERLTEQQRALNELERHEAADRQDVETLRREQFESMHQAAELRNRLRSAEDALQRTAVQRSRVEQESASADQDSSRLREEASDLAGRAERQREAADELRHECTLAEHQLRDARESQAGAVEVLAGAREREQSASARLGTLEDVATRFAGVSDGVRTLLTTGRASGVRTVGVVADFIEAGREVERVAEGYLDTFLPTVIVESDADLRRASELLRDEGAGRTSMISRSAPAGGPAVGTSNNGQGGIPNELLNDPRVRGRLRDCLTLRTSANGILQDRLGDAVLVDSLESALDLHRSYPATDYLTPEGDVVYSSGVVATGGRKNGDQGLLAHSRRMEEARAQSVEAASQVTRLHEAAEASRREVERLELDLQRSRQALDEAERERVTLELQLQRLEEETQRTDRRHVVLSEELAGLGEEPARSDRELRQLRREVDEAEEGHRALEAALERRVTVLDEKTVPGSIARRLSRARAEGWRSLRPSSRPGCGRCARRRRRDGSALAKPRNR
jgi:chromosome segregation protein